MRRRRVIGLAGALTAALAAVAVLLTGSDGGQRVPEGGSAFRAAASAAGPRAGTGLIDALAPVLVDARDAPPATATATATAAAGLPASQARAAARLFLIGFGGARPSRAVLARIASREWGGVVLEPGNGITPQQVASLVGRLRGAALAAGHPAPLIAATQPGAAGDAVPLDAPLPSHVADAHAARADALAAARALRAVGVRLVLAPVADAGAAGGPWDGRAFSDDPATVSALAGAALAGFEEGRVAAAPGHFPGEGAASGDPAREPATVGLSLDELRRADVRPFAALARRAPAIQLSAATYVAFDGVTPATVLPEAVTLLRRDLRFRGVVVSGDLAAASLATGEPVPQLAVEAVKAGCDLLWVPGDARDQEAAWRAVVRALRSGAIPAARVAEALRRVSQLRARYGVR